VSRGVVQKEDRGLGRSVVSCSDDAVKSSSFEVMLWDLAGGDAMRNLAVENEVRNLAGDVVDHLVKQCMLQNLGYCLLEGKVGLKNMQYPVLQPVWSVIVVVLQCVAPL
jgi:hypothetical protein